jgi:hypothetical protein
VSPGNTVVGNLIGTDIKGESAVGNTVGVSINAAWGNTIGGTAAGEGNVISGNAWVAVQIAVSTATGTVVLGKLLGTNKERTGVMGKFDQSGLPVGVLINDSPSNVIGGTTPDVGNVLAGFGVGVDISGLDAAGSAIAGNWIGADRGGNPLAVGNGIGVYINDVASNTVGGSTAGAVNVIRGYAYYGVPIYGAQAHDNVIQGNRIAPPSVGKGHLAGIAIEDASNNMLGGLTASAGNTLSGNAYAGAYIFGHKNSASGNVIEHNRFRSNGYGILLYNAANNGGYAMLLGRTRGWSPAPRPGLDARAGARGTPPAGAAGRDRPLRAAGPAYPSDPESGSPSRTDMMPLHPTTVPSTRARALDSAPDLDLSPRNVRPVARPRLVDRDDPAHLGGDRGLTDQLRGTP